MEKIEYDISSAPAIKEQAEAALTSAKSFVIDSVDMYGFAADELREIKGLQKMVEEQRTSITGPINAAVKLVNDLYRAPKEFLDSAESTIKRAMIGWDTEQQRIAAVARRAAEAAAAAERTRLDAIAREQREIAAKAEAEALLAQQQVEVAVANGDEAGAVEAMAIVNRAVDAVNTANEATISAEIVTFTPAIQAPSRVNGISSRVTYSAQVDNLLELIKAVADGRAPIQCIAADIKFLGAQARAFKKSGPLYPGVTAVAERGIAARSA
jgi:colicin import membrane protein